MHRRQWFWLCLLIAWLVTGCGRSPFVSAKGRIVKNGGPFRTQPGEGLRIFFVPLDPPQGSQYDSYAAEFAPKRGTFRVRGKDRQGLPPGKYRVTMQLMKKKEDMFAGRFMGKNSPFVCEVTDGGDEVVINLDQAGSDGRPDTARRPKSSVVK
jgi:hypothetical protein